MFFVFISSVSNFATVVCLTLICPAPTLSLQSPINVWPKPRLILWPKPLAKLISPNFTISFPHHHQHLTAAVDRYLGLIQSEHHHPLVTPSINISSSAPPLENLAIDIVDLTAPLQHGVNETYTLSISEAGTGATVAYLTAATAWGAMRGLETFSQLVWGDPSAVPVGLYVWDAPLFAHRGVMLDTSRNYYGVEDILRTIEAMGANKLNVFHWHITDSQSFPLIVPSEPELAAKGSYGPDMIYSPSDVAKIVQFGLEHGVRVLPEIDTPERVLEKIAHLSVEEVRLAFNVRSDLKKLEETMSSIRVVLLDAEQQQHQNRKLRRCMWKLRDIFYDAEDVIDEFKCEALRKQVVNHPSISLKVRCLASCSFPLSFSFKMGCKMREINQRLDELATEWNSFNLVQRNDTPQVFHRETYSFVKSSDVIGRDADKENIISLLMKPSENPVIPIVGIGGLGKTTLAQLVYNDFRISALFPLKIWVCVSEEFTLTRLLKLIIRSINKEEKCDDSTVEALQTCLRSLLIDKKFLLVLDDVWNEDRGRWIELRNLLMSMGDFPESKIIVTTRSLKVASIVSLICPYELKGLPHEGCLALFTKWAFNDGDERQHSNLMRIGEEIVKKCKGVPLAVKTLGSLLFLKTDESDWISIRDNEIWRLEQSENDIIPVLKLSYNHLPSHLQRCFAFLSLYKKDQIYYSDEVCQFWMANGLLEHSKQKQEWEDVGIRYLNELQSRCLIQKEMDYELYFTFKMHDLIHDLALDVSQKECKTVNCQTESVDEKIRHLSFCDSQLLKVPQVLKKLKNVRTVIVQEVSEESETIHESLINLCVSNFKYLRALCLCSSRLHALPNSIGTLKLLRALDLSNCHNIRKLPSSFYMLRRLLTLRMRGVPLIRLPDSMQSLIELRYLEITIKAKHLKKIQPGCWSSLQYLGLFYCDNLECLFEGMEHLTSLRRLCLFHCPKLVSLPRSLKFLTKLENLHIFACNIINLRMEPEEEEDRDLQLSLKSFSVKWSTVLTDLPRLLLEGSSTTLQQIRICMCDKLLVLPAWLQNLTSLHELELFHCSGLSALPEGMDRLTELRQLKIEECPTLSRRCRPDEGVDWHKIAHVQEVDIK